MKTTTLAIDERLLERIRAIGKIEDRSIASVIRYATSRYCDDVEKKKLENQ